MRFLSIVALIEFIDSFNRGGFTASISINEIKKVFKLINVPISCYQVDISVNNSSLIMEEVITLTFINDKYKSVNEKLYMPLAITLRKGWYNG